MATNNLELAVNHALNDYRTAVLREAAFTPGAGSLDGKRPNAWCEYGFPENPTFDTFYRLYRRGGVAHGAVTQLLEKCWQSNPWVIEGDKTDDKRPETADEKRLKTQLADWDFWYQFKEADLRRMVGRFSGLLIQFADNKKWDEPFSGDRNTRIAKFIPAWEGQLSVADWETDQLSENYGEPKAWQFNESALPGAPQGRQVTVHPDRIIILGNYREGLSFLEPGLNAFINLEKIEGGSGEAFLKNSARQLSVNFDKDTKLESLAAMYGVNLADLADAFNDGVRAINRAQDAALITQGATVSPLVANVPDPSPSYNVNLQTASASVRIPTRIIAGSQSGERASSEDLKAFNARGQGRRVNRLSRDASFALRHLQRLRLVDLPATGFSVMWDDLTEFTQTEKLAAAVQMSEINSKAANTGEPIFSDDQIRDTAGFENEQAKA